MIHFGKSPIIVRNLDGSDGAEDATGNNGRLILRGTMVTKTEFCISFLKHPAAPNWISKEYGLLLHEFPRCFLLSLFTAAPIFEAIRYVLKNINKEKD